LEQFLATLKLIQYH